MEKELDKKVKARYNSFNINEIKFLVIEDKWMASIEQSIKNEMDRISQRLTSRIKQLTERYENTLPQLSVKVGSLTAKVDEDLKKMGFKKK